MSVGWGGIPTGEAGSGEVWEVLELDAGGFERCAKTDENLLTSDAMK